jgi:hypothetical protein
MSNLVYTFTWRGIITIVRLENGIWECRYTKSKFFKFLNDRKHLNRIWRYGSQRDCFDAGMILGMQCEALLKYCKESYG